MSTRSAYRLLLPALLACRCFVPGKLDAQQTGFWRDQEDIQHAESTTAALRTDVFNASPTGNYDLVYHRIVWHVSPDTLCIAGSVTSYLRFTENASSVYFDMSDSLTADSVYFEGSKVDFQHSGNALQIFLPSDYAAGVLDSTTVYYHGVPPSSGFGSFVITQHDSINNLWTLSEPYGASDWWPCKQGLDDKIDSTDIYLVTPEAFRGGTLGLLVSDDTAGGYRTDHWKGRYPVATYLIGISVSNFDQFSLYAPYGEDSVLFYNLVYPENWDDAVAGINAIVPAFELYVQLFGDYSFAKEKYGHMQFGWGGGEEHQTMSSVTRFSFDLLVHEMAHQWFGDRVTCGSWRDIWLNEGFAVYCNMLCYDYIPGIHQYWHPYLDGTRNSIVTQPDGSVWVDDTTDVYRIFNGRLTYSKGAFVLHMLHWVLGDSAFFGGIQNYLNDPMLIYGFARTSDLQQHLEDAADTSLTEFLQEWFYGQGYPSYHFLWSQDADHTVHISVSQTTSDPSVQFFTMPLPVRLKAGNDSMDAVLQNTTQGQVFVLHPSFDVDTLIFDPDIWILSAGNTVAHVSSDPYVAPFVIYPNPAENELFIQYLSDAERTYHLRLFDLQGKTIADRTFNTLGENGYQTLDISTLATGMYMIDISSDADDMVQKIIVK